MALPERFTSQSNEVQSEIVLLGLKCWDLIQKESLKKADFDLEGLLNTSREEGAAEERLRSDKVKQQYETQVSFLESKLDHERSSKEKEIEEACKQIKKEFERNENILIRESRQEEKELQQKKFDQERKEFLEANTKLQIEIVKLQSRENWEDAYKSEKIQREALQKQLEETQRVRSSYEIGTDGEGEIQMILSQIQEWDFEDTHEITGMGDFRLTNDQGKAFMLDSKKYKDDVPKKEREKIIRDVDANTGILGGILVSLTSKIQTKKHCEIQLTPAKKPICYLVLEGMDTNAKRVCLQATLNLLLQYVASNNEREKDALLDKIHQASIKLGELKSDNENQRNKAKDLYDSLKLSGDKIQGVFNFLQDKSDEPEPSQAKKKPTKKKSEA
jgi:hypothetical protein